MFTRRDADAARRDGQPTATGGKAAPWWRTDPAPAGQPAATVPHSAEPHGRAAGDAGTTASGRAQGRAGAREGNDAAAQPQPHTAAAGRPAGKAAETDADGTGADGDAGTGAGGWDWAAARAWTTTAFCPPDIWANDLPSLSRLWAYASRGEWTTATGTPRLAGRVYALLVAVPVTGLLYALAWLVERPARLIVALTVLALCGLPPF